ncbi:alpha/beta hydrolase fold domain-containing protein [Gordonia sp. SID5947]|uniref:alpha/beta hydrolase fold domain-containing protein n=1 Tax=Gordonia sp. SID5947 TaxID=2690315 RepID=UPI0013711588|nr:alpha/beta hydrolase fold domain-containing protein [Gordonia sp. SID5947]MYR08300.1 alpha/beta hydrolase fold domain-containing protein [Gordonia sp. SID5947]
MTSEAPVRLSAKLEGRLSDPAMDLSTDSRMNPDLLATLTRFGFAANSGPSPVDRTSSYADRLAVVATTEQGFETFYAALAERPSGGPDVERTTEMVPGGDGNDIALNIFRPTEAAGPLPAVIYLHGGGMTMLAVDGPVHDGWCRALAGAGLVVVAVDFRNAGGVGGPHPFPAGLNDCLGALGWVHAERERLGVSTIVLQGESGGGNLALATALKAARDGTIGMVDGVYAMVPFISGGYAWSDDRKLRELPSMIENDGYFASCSRLDVLAATYDPDFHNAENPLCWPYFAGVDDLRGLPPHVISVNELDPLRDEGRAYYRKLLQAGVVAHGRVNLGLTHAAETIFPTSAREAHEATVADIKRFADSL